MGEKLSWHVFPERTSYPAIVSNFASTVEVAPLGIVENHLGGGHQLWGVGRVPSGLTSHRLTRSSTAPMVSSL